MKLPKTLLTLSAQEQEELLNFLSSLHSFLKSSPAVFKTTKDLLHTYLSTYPEEATLTLRSSLPSLLPTIYLLVRRERKRTQT
jgi:hypothetical protein